MESDSPHQQAPEGVWKQAKGESISCIFPTINDEIPSEAHKASQDIAIESMRISRFCDKNETDPVSLIIAAWSIVLRQYSEADLLHFGLNKPSETTGIVGSGPNDVQLLAVAINPDFPIKELLRSDSRTIYSLGSNTDSGICFNTGIEFRTKNAGDDLALGKKGRVYGANSQVCSTEVIM
jgi:hypothetical protein